MNGLADGAGLITGLIAGPIAGLAAGAAHFGLLRWNTDLYLRPGGLGRAIALQALRLGLLGALLVVLARQGAGPLLLGALGVLAARGIVLRRIAPRGARGAVP